MCGIVGIYDKDLNIESLIIKMMKKINHRGPDDDGYTISRYTAIGMTRLSIIDISNGHQPIHNSNGNLSIVFNGEIYNYKQVRDELKKNGVFFSTNTDTEVVLKAYETWGPPFLEKIRGMFSFAILNKIDESIFIARDRLGVKPLYYSIVANQFIFASELKCLLLNPKLEKKIDLESVDKYLTYRYVPGPKTMFKNIQKFPPGHFMILKNSEHKFKKYWPPENLPRWKGDFTEAQEAFEEKFDEATRIRMLSERPVGAFLSGGLDSTSIVASLTKQFSSTLKTFSVGFNWHGDELKIASQTAKKLNCDHHEIICDINHTRLLPKILWHLDEPVGDGIILPMYLLSKLASEKVSVVQSGEGADELMGGYFMHRVLYLSSIYSKIVPSIVNQKLFIPLIKSIPNWVLNNFFDYPGNLGEDGKKRLIIFLNLMKNGSYKEKYQFLITLFNQEEKNSLYEKKIIEHSNFEADVHDLIFNINEILNFQYDDWLPDDILFKLDKLTMAHSLEGRVPFLDHKLVELLNSFPLEFKINLFKNKQQIRNYLNNNDQKVIANSKKKPFYIPIDQYINDGFLKDIFSDFFSKTSVSKRGLFKWEKINELKNSLNPNNVLAGKKIFSLGMLELWYRIFIDEEKGWL